MKIAFVMPDGLSVLLFSQGILRTLKSIDGAHVAVLSSDGKYRAAIEDLGVRSIFVDNFRFFDPVSDFRYIADLYRIFRAERFDVVFNFSTKPNVYGAIAARLAGVQTVLGHVVGLGAAFMWSAGIKRKILGKSAMVMYRLAMSLTDKVWFTNGNDAAFFVTQELLAPSKVVVTNSYLDPEEYSADRVKSADLGALRSELHLRPDERMVVMVARMIWQKGIREFAEAAEILKSRNPSLRFILVAPLESGSAEAVPESYIREREKLARLQWLGFREDVKRIYAACDLAVLPSYYKEGGYPRGLLEPMAMGKPVIAADTPDCRGPVEAEKNGYLVPPKNSEALAARIHEIMLNEKLRMSFGRHSRLRIENDFDERKIVPEALRRLGMPVSVTVPSETVAS